MANIRSFKPKKFPKLNIGFTPNRPQTTEISMVNDKLFVNKQSLPFSSSKGVLRLTPLGGVGDVQKNMYVYEYGNDIVIVDCGVGFPDDAMPGVDLVIPDISYLRDKKDKIRGIVITHGHDDHIGGLPYLWPELNVPIYSQKLTCGFIKGKFTEHNLPKDQIKALNINDTIKLGAFNISFYQAAHSIPDSTGIILQTPVGIIVHQADFKIDWTPVNGQVTDVGKLARFGEQGILLMAIDCLRVEKQGYTLSEKSIEGTFAQVERDTQGKVIITMTSSNITRIQQAVNVASNSGRKLALAGRSMENNFQIARDLGYLDVQSGLLIAQEEIKRFPDNKLIILMAGAFGQPESALARAANYDHKFVQLKKKDAVVFSADPIPSAEVDQGRLIDRLTTLGCKVYYSAMTSDLHVSGHAASEELKLMLGLAKPQYILPIGGNYRHMRVFSEMAQGLGYKEDQILLPVDGDMIDVGKNQTKINGHVNVSNVYVDGLGVGDVGSIVLRDRQQMSEEGVVIVIASIDQQTSQLASDPDIISRGFVFEKESEELIEAAKGIVKSLFRDRKDGKLDWRYMRHEIEENLNKFFYQETKRNPLILPFIVEV